MAERTPLADPPDLAEAVFFALEEKARLPVASLIVLGILAGIYIGLGGLFATVALAGADVLPFGVGFRRRPSCGPSPSSTSQTS